MVAAFIFAIIGDYFLGIRTTQLGFILGILGFFLAHAGFLTYAWHNITGRGQFRWPVFLVVFAGLLVYFFTILWPGLRDTIPLAIAVIVYMMISCATLTASVDLGGNRPWTWVFAVGVAFLVFSDTLVAARHFAGRTQLYGRLMWPTFYSAMIFMALGVLLQHLLRGRRYLDDTDTNYATGVTRTEYVEEIR